MGTAALTIEIDLPRDRYHQGVLRVMHGADQLVRARCLGRAAAELAISAGNAKRDPLKRNGDTPTGTYLAPLGIVRFHRHMEGFGVGWIPLDPIGGQALIAEQRGRSGLAIHGGRGNARLVPTAGCVRISDDNFALLAKAIGAAKGFTVTIREGA